METEEARGTNAWSMKRQGASSERKRARIPSGKAGAEGGGMGAVADFAAGCGPGRVGGVLASGLITISLKVLSPAPHKHPTVRRNLLFGFKRVESEGLMAKVALLWSQICV